jgi:Tfp pilus assembly PilM family ATPase
MLDFLTLEPTAFGVDISDFSVKIARLKRKGRNFDLACIGEEPIPAGLVEGGEIKDEPKLADIIRRAVGQAKGQKTKTKEVISSLPDEKVFLKII